jgi:hypothetical protein
MSWCRPMCRRAIGNRLCDRRSPRAVFNRSRVDRASRSSRVTITTSPPSSWSSSGEAAPCRSWPRSPLRETPCPPHASSNPRPERRRSGRPSISVRSRKSSISLAPRFCTKKAQSLKCLILVHRRPIQGRLWVDSGPSPERVRTMTFAPIPDIRATEVKPLITARRAGSLLL